MVKRMKVLKKQLFIHWFNLLKKAGNALAGKTTDLPLSEEDIVFLASVSKISKCRTIGLSLSRQELFTRPSLCISVVSFPGPCFLQGFLFYPLLMEIVFGKTTKR